MTRKIWRTDQETSGRSLPSLGRLLRKPFLNGFFGVLEMAVLTLTVLQRAQIAAQKCCRVLQQEMPLPKPMARVARVVGYASIAAVIITGLGLNFYHHPWLLVPAAIGLCIFNTLPNSRGRMQPTLRPLVLPSSLPVATKAKTRVYIPPSIRPEQKNMPPIGKQNVLQLGWQAPDEWYAPVQDTSSPLTKTELEDHQPTTMLDYSRLDLFSRGHVERQYCR